MTQPNTHTNSDARTARGERTARQRAQTWPTSLDWDMLCAAAGVALKG